jgi:hypothetical protein
LSIVDDVLADLSEAYPRMSRDDFDKIVTLAGAGPSEGSGLSVAVALEPIVPSIGDRLKNSSAKDTTEYLRLLRGAANHVVSLWEDPTADAPAFSEVEQFVKTIES